MLTPLLVGTLMIFVNMVTQVLTEVILIRIFVNRRERSAKKATVFENIRVLAFALTVLFAGTNPWITLSNKSDR